MITGKVKKIDGKWGYVIYLPRDENGKYQQKKKQGFSSKSHAEAAMREMIGRLEAGTPKVSISVAQYLDLWIEKGVEGKRSPRTVDNYKMTTRYIKEAFGSVKLDDLAPHQIERLYESLGKRLSSSTVHTVHRHLRAALNRAIKWGYLKETPLKRVDSPSLHTPKRSTMSVEQAQQALEWLRTRHHASYIGIYLAIYTGMRRSEVCGLQWNDIDWVENVIHISRTRQQRKGEIIIGGTKTKLSERSIRVSEDVIKLLRDWRRKQREHSIARGDSWDDNNFVHRQLTGELCGPDSLTHDLRSAEIALDLPLITFHDLRHTHATILLEAGVPLKTVSDRLGHSSIRVTADTYAHVTKKMESEAVDKFDQAFRKKTLDGNSTT